MAKPKERKVAERGIKPHSGAAPAELTRRGIERGKEKAKEQFRDGGMSRSESPEEYGGDTLEQGAETVAGRVEYAVRDAGSAIKDKAYERIRNRQSGDRVRESPDAPEGECAGDATDSPQEPDIRQRPEQDAAQTIKTKENYVRSETGESADHVREKSHRRPDLDKAGSIHTQGKAEAARATDRPAYTETQAYQGGKELAEAQAQSRVRTRDAIRQPSARVSTDAGKRTIKTAEKSTVKAASKGTVKTAEASVRTAKRSVKTAQKGAEVTVKAAKAAAKTTQKTAETAAKAAKAAAQTAAKAAQLAAKTMAAAFKAIVAGIKALVAAIAAGGWVAVLIIAAIALVGLLLCTAFGVFTADETEDGTKPMSEAVYAIDSEFRAEMDTWIADLSVGDYDEVSIDYMGDIDGDSAYVNNWNDVLATYAVLLTTDETDATDVITVTPEKVARLRSIFYEMNEVNYASEIIEEEIPPDPDAPQPTPMPDGELPEPETKRVLHIYVTVKSLNYKEAADLYRMTDQQREVLDEMMSAEFAMLFAEIAGVDVLGGADLTQIISGLPTSGEGAEVVKSALTKLGAPYVWGAKGDSKFDCSGLAYWSIKQVDASLGDRMYTNAAGQAKYCYDRGLTVGESELQPGDLVFWQNLKCNGCHRWEEVHHVGIYIGGGKVVEASSGKGRVVIRDLWSTTNYPIYMFGRPY